MSNEIVPQVFDNEEFGQIRTFTGDDGTPWFVGKDVASALGYTNPQKAIRDHVDEEDRTVNDSFTVNGTAVTLVNESGIYALILTSKLPKAKEFKHWITSDVLPAIRRDGGYMAARDETPEETMARAVLLAQRTIERQRATIAGQDRRIAELEPKALFADAVSASDGTCLVGELAKMMTQAGFTVGQNRLFAILRNDGYLGKSGSNRNVPLQRYVEQGLFSVKETAITHSDGHVTISRTTKVTGKGQRYFIERYCMAIA